MNALTSSHVSKFNVTVYIYYELEILAATGGLELRTSYMQCSSLIHQAIRPNRLCGFGVPKVATL